MRLRRLMRLWGWPDCHSSALLIDDRTGSSLPLLNMLHYGLTGLASVTGVNLKILLPADQKAALISGQILYGS